MASVLAPSVGRSVAGASSRAVALFAASDLLLSASIGRFVLCALTAASVLSAALSSQGAGHQSTVRYSVLTARGLSLAVASWLFCYGLKHCGPLHAIQLETATSLLLAKSRTSAQRRMLLALLALLLLLGTRGEHPHRGHGSAATAVGVEAQAEAWPEHLLGDGALVAATAISALLHGASRRLEREAGGPWRLFARTTAAAAVLVALPLACEWLWSLRGRHPTAGATTGAAHAPFSAWWWLSASLCMLLGPIGGEKHGAAASGASAAARSRAATLGVGCAFLTACGLEWLRAERIACYHTWIAMLLLMLATKEDDAPAKDGNGIRSVLPVSIGRWSGGAFCAGLLTGGRSDGEGKRLRHYGGDSSFEGMGKALSRAVFASRSSTALAGFLALNVGIMALEATVGVLSHSLTLATDAAHMLLDCAALAVGLYGEASARWPASAAHPFGFARFDPLCALVNALLLLLVAVSVVGEGIHRMVHARSPIDDARLLPVAVAGLAINLVGLVCFHGHVHTHTQAGSDGCGGGGCSPAQGANSNMRGVFLHVLADTMGSVATIASTLLARHLRWQWADPCCSLLVAGCIFAAAFPLLRDSALLLLLPTPEPLRGEAGHACRAAIRALPHVREVRSCRFWSHTSARALGAVTVLASPEANEREVAMHIERIGRGYNVYAIAVEVQKE